MNCFCGFMPGERYWMCPRCKQRWLATYPVGEARDIQAEWLSMLKVSVNVARFKAELASTISFQSTPSQP